MRLIIPVTVLCVGVGCSSNWVVRGDPVPLRNCQSKLFYQDGDQDGWGDGSASGAWVVTCDADAESGFTASNGRDCDDSDPTNTGAVGSVCPESLAADDLYSGLALAGSEYMAILGTEPASETRDSSRTNYTAASSNCASWAGRIDLDPDPEIEDWMVNGHLATFSSTAEVDAVQSLVEDSLIDDEGIDVYIGAEWSGSDPLAGEWAWVDGGTDPVSDLGVAWCDGSIDGPDAGDFTPAINPNDDEGFDGGDESSSPQSAALAEMANVRLAMIFDGTGWCLGVPAEPQNASYVCERAVPDPLDYVELATEEEIEAGESGTE